jgi:hypothetical protein
VSPRGRTATAAAILLMSCGAHRAGGAPWIGAAQSRPPSREVLLDRTADAMARGDLTDAGDALTALADRERGRADPALDFWSELLALARCEPLVHVPRVAATDPPLRDPWERLRRLVQIERVRLARRSDQSKETPKMLMPTPAAGRNPARVTWPLETERWPDETPVPGCPPSTPRPLPCGFKQPCSTSRTRGRRGR